MEIKTCADFLTTFRSADDFHSFVESLYFNEHSRVALPLLLSEELEGYGFALACDFLKESGYSGFVKPDTHLNHICRAFGITSATRDFGVFKDVVSRHCTEHDMVPFEFDKLIWLVGSGRLYLNRMRIGRHHAVRSSGGWRCDERIIFFADSIPQRMPSSEMVRPAVQADVLDSGHLLVLRESLGKNEA